MHQVLIVDCRQILWNPRASDRDSAASDPFDMNAGLQHVRDCL